MSNLGWYQKMTTVAKMVGGPQKLFGIVLGGGITLGVCGTKLSEFCAKKVKNKSKNVDEKVYVVKEEGTSNEGLLFKVGDEFKVLEYDADSVLIEKYGEEDNPYFVSYNLLKDISNYRK